jgi:hypothetical protein
MNQLHVQCEKKSEIPKNKDWSAKESFKGLSSKSIFHHTKPHTPILGSSPGQMKKKSLHSLNVNRVSILLSGPLSHQANYHTAQATSHG